MKISIITHTRDSAQTLPRLLATTAWADERIVVDMASGDTTRELAEQAGCRVLHAEPAPRVDGIRNAYLDVASNDWILVLDSDEYLADDAEAAIAALLEAHNDNAAVEAFSIPRFNYIGDTLLRGSGWYPDPQIRLFRKGCLRWSDSNHQSPQLRGGMAALHILEPPGCLHIHHRNYTDLRDLISRQLRYALDDSYPDDAARFDYGDAVSRAYQAFAARHHPDTDGDLSTALATIMAWDELMRGLIQWDRLERKPALERAFALPIATALAGPQEQELLEAQRRLAELEGVQAELDAIKATTVWRVYRGMVRRFPRLLAGSGRAASWLLRRRG